MKINPSITPLLAALGSIFLSACQSNTVYFVTHGAPTIQHVPADGGTPQVLIAAPGMVEGLAVAPKEQRLYLAAEGGVVRLRMDGTADGEAGYMENLSSMALDEQAGRLYWTEQGRPILPGRTRLMSSNLQGGDRREFVSCLANSKVAVNPSQGLLYWTHEYDHGIWMAKLDGTGKRRIGQVATHAVSLAVDQQDGKVFWGSAKATPGFPARITAACFDGTKQESIVTLAEGRIVGLAVDEDARRIVWLEHLPKVWARIRSAKFDGTAIKTIHEFTGDNFARAIAIGPPRK